jgi:hypothetical protein
LFVAHSSLHCLTDFCCAVAGWDKPTSPANAAHATTAVKVGITHLSGKVSPSASVEDADGNELPRRRPPNTIRSPDRQRKSRSLFVLSLSRQNRNRKQNGGTKGAAVACRHS